MTCRRAAELISYELDLSLPFHQRAGLRFHTILCGACRRFRRQLGAVDEVVAECLGSPGAGDRTAALPDESKDRLRAVIVARLEENS
jgi:hypothetical protein